MQVAEVSEIWVKEPRWSWYRTPLRQCVAVVLSIQVLSYANRQAAHTGSLTKADFTTHIEYHRLYFTPEEYVMFKITYDANRAYDMQELRQGIIYS